MDSEPFGREPSGREPSGREQLGRAAFAGSGNGNGSGSGTGGRGARGRRRGRGAGTWAGRADETGSAPGPARRAAEAKPPLSPPEQAREICLRLLSFRPRTRTELAAALRQRGIEDDVAAEVLDRYSDVGMIDDRAFAQAWVTSRHHGKGLARRALAGELRRKGVDAESVDAALDELAPDTEIATARALVDRKLRGDRGAPADALFRRLVGMLARKGYPAGLAVRVVKDALAERAEAAAEEALELAEFDPDVLDSGAE